MCSVPSGKDLLKPELINAGVCIHFLCLQYFLMQCRFYGRCTFAFFTVVRSSNSKSQLSKPKVHFEKFRIFDMFVFLFNTGNLFYWQPAGATVWIVRYNQCLKSTNIPDLPATNKFLLLRAPSACNIVLKCSTCSARRHKIYNRHCSTSVTVEFLIIVKLYCCIFYNGMLKR